ncbi:MAG: hypothetical protein R2827_11170 [Bdellovibrionales bacterium]
MRFLPVLSLFFCIPAFAIDVDSLLKKVDEMYRANSSYAQFTMQVINPRWQRELKIEAWTKGLDKSFLTILSPNKDPEYQHLS